jgi:hypothetical protein
MVDFSILNALSAYGYENLVLVAMGGGESAPQPDVVEKLSVTLRKNPKLWEKDRRDG